MNAAARHVQGPSTLPKPVLLVVEDDVLSRFSVCDTLRHAGFTVIEASSEAEAVAVLKATLVDLVFIDVHLPGPAEGLAVARYAREHQPEAKLVLTSGKLPASAIPDLPSLGPFLAKPYLLSRVIQVIRNSLAEAER